MLRGSGASMGARLAALLGRVSYPARMRCRLLLLCSVCGACSEGTADGTGGAPAVDDDRYVIEDVQEDCDDVEGLHAAAILDATGLAFEGELSWTDLETGYEASRTIVHVEVEIEDEGTITCVPFRHLPGQAPTYARLSYDAVTLTMTSDDGRLDETGSAVAWLAETDAPGTLTLEVVRALPVDDAEGTIEASPALNDSYQTLVLVYSSSEDTPLGHVSIASEPVSTPLEDGDTAVGVSMGYFPALP